MKFTCRFLFLATLSLTLICIFYLISTSNYDLTISKLYTIASPLPSQTNPPVPHLEAENAFDKQIWKKVTSANAQHVIFNKENYAALTDHSLVIVVQVHSRIDYLRALIESMSRVKDIQEALLVFSHDVYDEEINQLIKEISFAKVTQIFYPFSIQIWSHTYPGPSPTDCSRNLAKEKALSMNCSNAKYPDTYGHYREADITQTKHHWWWKINYLFDHFPYTKEHNGDFLFIEEDHYLLPDFIHTWKLMNQLKTKLAHSETKVDLLTLGNYESNYNIKTQADKLHHTEWFSNKHNMGFTVDRKLWNNFKIAGSSVFCTYDEYNWDWTLQHIIQDNFDENLLTLVSIVPRVVHIGTCGMHHKKADCTIDKQVQSLQDVYSTNKGDYFSPNFTVIRLEGKKLKLVNNGGWSDPRDFDLCLQYELPFEQIIHKNVNFRQFLSDQ